MKTPPPSDFKLTQTNTDGSLSGSICAIPTKTKWSPKIPNAEWHALLRKRLRDNVAAMRFLSQRGLTEATIQRFGLGLSKPYTMVKTHRTQENALVFPLLGPDGKFYKHYGYCNLPGVTKNPLHPRSWMKGAPKIYYSDPVDKRTIIIVCHRVSDVWPLWQALGETDSNSLFLLIASTQEGVFPSAWMKHDFWAKWEAIYLAFDNNGEGDHLSSKLIEIIGRETYRIRPPKSYGNTWDNFWFNGGSAAQIQSLLQEAPILSSVLKTEDERDGALGRFAYEPVDINGAFKDGYLYCTVQTLSRGLTPIGAKSDQNNFEVVERLETVVVRSDRSIHTASWMKAPPGTKYYDRVLRLSDGTLIDREPRPNKYGTWSWPSVKAYLEDRSRSRSLAQILHDVMDFLKTSVWLPFEEDYSVLALTVPVTYVQSVFDSVPLIFLNGPASSGKSEAGRAMTRICANAVICGQSSAATIARFIDESRGFVVLDDLEAIGSRGGEFSELVQALKQSYNKETAIKFWTDVKTMRAERLNFFGVKMVNNTRGVDHILGSRMIRIQTRPVPDAFMQEFQERRLRQCHDLPALRDELHTWAFENVSMVDAEYANLYPQRADRADEIAAPLKVFASLASSPDFKRHLEMALARQRYKPIDVADPIQMLQSVLRDLIAAGYITVSITHVVLELRKLISQNFVGEPAREYPDWVRHDWVGKQLRNLNLIDTDGGIRKRVFGLNLRFYPIRSAYIDEVKRQYALKGLIIEPTTMDPSAFCLGCEGCAYRDCGCEILPRRLMASKF